MKPRPLGRLENYTIMSTIGVAHPLLAYSGSPADENCMDSGFVLPDSKTGVQNVPLYIPVKTFVDVDNSASEESADDVDSEEASAVSIARDY